MKRVLLALGGVALLEMMLLYRLEQRSSLLFVGLYLLLAAASGAAVIAHTARQMFGITNPVGSRAAVSPADRLWILLAGVLLIVPGILSDLAALILLAPPGRMLVSRWIGPRWRGWISSSSNFSGTWTHFGPTPGGDSNAPLDEHTIDVTSRPVNPRRRAASEPRA